MDIIREENNQNRFIADKHEYNFRINGVSENVAERIEQRKKEELSQAMQKYMPIGSVVKIKDSFQYYMIIGFNYKSNDGKFDYLACQYPYGVDIEHSTTSFNHEDIEKIFHIGFVNNQEKHFKAELIGVLNNNNELER